MNREQLFSHAKSAYNTTPDYPWGDQNAVLRHAHNGKWYGIVLTVKFSQLAQSPEQPASDTSHNPDDILDVLNVKCDPLLIGSIRQKTGIHPAYHMNKERWLSIRLDGSVPAQDIESLLSLSYQLTE